MPTTERPTLTAARAALVQFLWSGPWEHVDTNEMSSDDFALIETGIEDVIARMCSVVGHEWEHDQCGIPSHQFCLYCRTPITARALEAQKAEP